MFEQSSSGTTQTFIPAYLNKVMRNVKAVGISLPKDILDWVDKERGDVSRSRFLLRIIKKEIN